MKEVTLRVTIPAQVRTCTVEVAGDVDLKTYLDGCLDANIFPQFEEKDRKDFFGLSPQGEHTGLDALNCRIEVAEEGHLCDVKCEEACAEIVGANDRYEADALEIKTLLRAFQDVLEWCMEIENEEDRLPLDRWDAANKAINAATIKYQPEKVRAAEYTVTMEITKSLVVKAKSEEEALGIAEKTAMGEWDESDYFQDRKYMEIAEAE